MRNGGNRETVLKAFAFEDVVADLFVKLGYDVVRNARIGKMEVDLIASLGGAQIPVEVSIVRVESAMLKLRADAERLRSLSQTVDISRPIVVVGSELTPAAKAWAESQYAVDIWDLKELFDKAAPFKEITARLQQFKKGDPTGSAPNDSESDMLRRQLSDHFANNDLSPSAYETLCMSVFIKLFDPYLYGFQKQAETSDGGNRYDFICRIQPGNPFWDGIRQDFRTKAILFECKNYGERIGPDQVYSTERYLFSGALRTVCILISRFGANEGAIRAAQGAMRESGKLLILLSNLDLIEMLKLSSQEGAAENFLDKRIWDFIVSLPR
ncbi:hypothetical protein MesoLj113c_45580 [Mesorhizobium sp. 113-3-9]|uniref:restriction endonuclease n=1 Tax=Mesorhizobium sp. 113-3-9 TaxID=2744517 RepID=UPI001927DBE5|nr:restriction endonuclease [Mesorhizobium sp. 113-3-9]BCG88448.1 hypothetical protein MesoLj113c_45580 [Mesorhizobium sp. 113-3-9]